jgi:hypothetical protein
LLSAELARRGDAGRHRLFDQDVLARLEASLREFSVLIHAGQHKNCIDIVNREERSRGGWRRDRWIKARDRRSLVAVDVENGSQARKAVLLELANQPAIGSLKDATESKYPESKHVCQRP